MYVSRAFLAAQATVPTGGVGREIGRRAARLLAQRELGKVGWWQRILHWIASAAHAADRAVVTGWTGRIVLLVLAVVLITVLARWALPQIFWSEGRPPRASAEASSAPTAAQYRLSAQRHASADEYGAAIVDSFRAIGAGLEERQILAPDPGRTADELATATSRELPAHAVGLRQAARLFDGVRYGDYDGTREGYQQVSQVEQALWSAAGRAGRPDRWPPGKHDRAVPLPPAQS